jgi:hypothetical protein
MLDTHEVHMTVAAVLLYWCVGSLFLAPFVGRAMRQPQAADLREEMRPAAC